VRVNVIGAAPGWRDAPEDEGENWGVNNTHLFEKRIDLIVDVHNRFNPKKLREEKKDLFHVGALTYKEIPAYFQREVEGFPTIKKYPRDEIIKKFGVDYFGSGRCGLFRERNRLYHSPGPIQRGNRDSSIRGVDGA
jgi:hypothetical protein